MKSIRSLAFAAAAGVALMTGQALAQKSADTLRLAVSDPFIVLSSYCVPLDEAGSFYRRVYETLLRYDEHNHKIVPRLAKSWRRVNPTTLEFDLQEGVTFHNGNKFDADDVVATIEFSADEKNAFPFKTRYNWVKHVEKLGPYKVRVESAEPNAIDIVNIEYAAYMLDAETLAPLQNKCDYGRVSPYGTGAYKVTSIDKNAGITVERFDGVRPDPTYVRAPIGKIQGIPIPDAQTQIAQLLTGNLDILRNVQPDNAVELARNPKLEVSTLPASTYIYIVFDGACRSKVKALSDPRVRKAIWMAMDRDGIIKSLVPGGAQGIATKMDALCFDTAIACGHTVPNPSYDPASAKKLLADAGYADGFDMVYTCWAPIKPQCEAIAGDLLKVGIRVTVEPVTINVARKKKEDGETTMLSITYPTASYPDTGVLLDTFFGGNRDYARDAELNDLIAKGTTEFDDAKRTALYTKAMDINSQRNYVMAFSTLPTLYVHTKDVAIKPNPLSAGDNYIDDYFWK